MIPTVLPGVKAVHAVDATGVHPLLLAIGSERYVPYARRTEPQELLTQANAILGQGQLSLAKYLFIVAQEDDPALAIHDIPAFFRHLLSRVDLTRDLHFQTRTTIDTLDYSGGALNKGSKLVIAAVGEPVRTLGTRAAGGAAAAAGLRRSPGGAARACWWYGRRRSSTAGAMWWRMWLRPARCGRGGRSSISSRWWCWWTTASSRRVAWKTSCG